jgi:predicted alpha/beta-fold hydrolase
MKVRARSSWQRRSAYIALGVLSLLLVVFIGFAAWQGKKMVTNPHATRDMPKESPRDFGLPEQEVVVKNSDGMHLVGWWLQSRNGRYVIAQHGYKDTRDQMLNEAAMLVKHGYGVLVSTVRAHDKSEGEAISFGVRETDDLAAWFRLIKEKEPGATVCLLGNSMGGAVALEYAAIFLR